MSTRRGAPDWLKKTASWLAALAVSEAFRECFRQLIRWIDEIRSS
ncbi:UNVERIFIED_ORG: hypothetical protein J2Y77_001908 [Pseudomonas lini]|uniref:Uncharacterized protein n=1 Tax=Pseudomonas viciae TaxID=2505979 RepID=A0ABY8P7N9_9PSED|nr:hypothetical protein [Pseudomonas viciae]WGO90931.1 hypothetical protein QCD61_14385 [Pseudomonas viciae]